MNKILLIIIILIIIPTIYYTVFGGSVEAKFKYMAGSDIFGYDMPGLNNEFKASGNTTIKDAMVFALKRPETVGFVRLNTGETLFKSTKTGNYTPCINNLCTGPNSGLYLKV